MNNPAVCNSRTYFLTDLLWIKLEEIISPQIFAIRVLLNTTLSAYFKNMTYATNEQSTDNIKVHERYFADAVFRNLLLIVLSKAYKACTFTARVNNTGSGLIVYFYSILGSLCNSLMASWRWWPSVMVTWIPSCNVSNTLSLVYMKIIRSAFWSCGTSIGLFVIISLSTI